MKTEQDFWLPGHGWRSAPGGDSDLVLLFGGTAALKDESRIKEIRSRYPGAQLIGCSTSGEVCGTRVLDESIVSTAVRFEKSSVRTTCCKVSDPGRSRWAGEAIANGLPAEGLVHVFVLSEGIHINGSELVKGLAESLPPDVRVTGGLSGDGDRFKETLVLCNSPARPDTVAAIGLYGDGLTIGFGCLGGWDPFGPHRRITRSRGNVLYEMDGQSALKLYTRYLGEYAKDLPASGLLFPLSLRGKEGNGDVVRTILAVDEKEQSMTFAGDVPEGAQARFMKANFDRLIEGASGAARATLGDSSPELAILISCVGRKLVLKQRVEEEVESVRDVLGDGPALAGFYSYGEISPFVERPVCELHNQTMTVTTFSEH